MNLDEILRETDALTFINAFKVTLVDLKEELSEQDRLAEYMEQSREKTRKLIRRADNQYRMITRVIQKEVPVATNVTVDGNMASFDAMKELMEGE